MYHIQYAQDADTDATSVRQRIEQIVEPILRHHSCALVDIHQSRQRKRHQIRLVLCRDGGGDGDLSSRDGVGEGDLSSREGDLSSRDLERIHKTLLPRLTVLLGDQDIALELSTPGIGYVFKRDSDYRVFAGKRVRVLTAADGGWRYGHLLGAFDNRVRIKEASGATTEYDQHDIIKITLSEDRE